MKIAILTQPILDNYGGVLQNYALQKILIRLGHEPITIDYQQHVPWPIYIYSTIKSALFWFAPSLRRPFLPLHGIKRRSPLFQSFIDKHVALSSKVYIRYSLKAILENNCEAIIVGSDQVWRPIYNVYSLEDLFLHFAKKFTGKKIAYAASFGTDHWEFNEEQTLICSKLIKYFNSVSVRELSGVNLCRTYLNTQAEVVLDPTLLLDKSDYMDLCAKIPFQGQRVICAYLLDPTKVQLEEISNFAKSVDCRVKLFSAHEKITLSVEEWLACFRDADYIITDSFHGMIFSLIFHKEFFVYINKERGASRFYSLLSNFSLESRIVDNLKSIDLFDNRINYLDFEEQRSTLREFSIKFLISSLNS